MAVKVKNSDLVWSYAGTASSMLVNLVLLPVMIFFIESDELGLWQIFISVGTLVTLLDFGFNPTIARNIAYCWSGAKDIAKTGKVELPEKSNVGPNFELLKKLTTTCRVLYGVISLVALLMLAAVATPYIVFVAGDAGSPSVFASWAVYAFAVILNLYYGYFATFLRGVGAIRSYYKIMTISRFLQFLLSVTLMILGFGIIAPAIAYLAYGFLLRQASKHSFMRHNNIGDRLKGIPWKTPIAEVKRLFGIMWFNAWRDGLVSLSGYLAGQATVLIAAVFLSLTETGIYSISVQLITAIMTLSAVTYSAHQPALQMAYFEGDIALSRFLMAKAMCHMIVIYVLLLAVLVTVGAPLLSWIRPGVVFDAGVIAFLGIANFFYKRMQLYASFISNTNNVPYMLAFLISSASGIALASILMGPLHLGMWGLLVGQMLPQIYNYLKWPNEVYSMLNTSFIEMARLGLESLRKSNN